MRKKRGRHFAHSIQSRASYSGSSNSPSKRRKFAHWVGYCVIPISQNLIIYQHLKIIDETKALFCDASKDAQILVLNVHI
ncbi:hypothetical protein RCL_jg28331.t1 [Rhizophagus clarus]|uniref:Uncharacterized protein n=1 Tax=Rhizophagus clarus TaxID=94130 RepID=A0A8H3QXJ3_9GLOM|nr:hypothetical protein RCL_jg28331.t1 [Rhizophagus clarus]